MRSYRSWVAGLIHNTPDGRSRERYAAAKVRIGDRLDLSPERNNPHDEDAVAFLPRGFHLGYVPARHDWVCRSIAEGDTLEARVTDLRTERTGWFSRKATNVEVQITIVKDG